jgi:hypothetical protein
MFSAGMDCRVKSDNAAAARSASITPDHNSRDDAAGPCPGGRASAISRKAVHAFASLA